jgi:hypothetical protein
VDIGQMGAALVAAFVIMRIIDQVVKPAWCKFKLDEFWYPYLALLLGVGLGWFTGINALPVFGVAPIVGRLLTCLTIGLGPSFLFDLVKGRPELPKSSS